MSAIGPTTDISRTLTSDIRIGDQGLITHRREGDAGKTARGLGSEFGTERTVGREMREQRNTGMSDTRAA